MFHVKHTLFWHIAKNVSRETLNVDIEFEKWYTTSVEIHISVSKNGVYK